jgi:KUP system potassium uptake protein
MEGLEIATPLLKPYVVPISAAILVGLFLVQRLGTGVVGRYFGPVIVLWFATLAVTGVVHIAREPAILAALNPAHAATFLAGRGWHVFAAVGAIVLAITGAEALYADMGHFGRRPIRLAWNGLVLPSLALNYLGQGALLMADPGALENPFYRLFPAAWVWPALVLATLAAIIASQAVISGAYSMTQQAIQLGFLPRMSVRYTSAREAGQIYMPAVNWALLAGVIAAVVGFGSSSALAGAYGIAVTLTMMITTVLTYFVVREGWRLPAPLALGATAFFLALDALLVAGCAVKFFDGGWFPIALGLLLFGAMSTWAHGREQLVASIRRDGVALEAFVDGLDPRTMPRVERTAVYPVADASTVPQALLHNLKHYQVLHQHNVVLTVVFREVPWVPMHDRVEVETLGHGFWRVRLNFGFMNVPDVPKALALAAAQGLTIPTFETSYFLSRETVAPRDGGGLASWRERLFAAMSRNAGGVVDFFRLPANAVVELGTRVTL